MTDKKSLADWVHEHAIAADSLDPRAPLDDLEPLRELIGDAVGSQTTSASIVSSGEQRRSA